jgi:hypothetical protein
MRASPAAGVSLGEPRGPNRDVRVAHPDHLVRKHERAIAITIPPDPRCKVKALGLTPRGKKVPKSTFVCLLISSEIGSRIRQDLEQRLSIVELGERKISAPHFSIAIAKLNYREELLHGLIFRNRDQTQLRRYYFSFHRILLVVCRPAHGAAFDRIFYKYPSNALARGG